MGIVQAQANMSLDGYVAKPDNTIGRLFDWLQNGEVAIPTPAGDFTVHLTPPSAEHWRRWVSSVGALVCGRTLFDVTEGWQGRHSLDVPVVVVTHQVPTEWVEAHPDAPFSFVTEGVEVAIARARDLAGDRVVAVAGGTIARQCLDLGLLDEVAEGWQGRHTLDVPVVVVTHRVPADWAEAHPDAPFTFVTNGVEAAVARAQELAGDRVVAITGGTIARQCLDLGLLDEVAVDLVPVVMGEGNRPFFGKLSTGDVLLGNPTVCLQGDRVTHLVFPVLR